MKSKNQELLGNPSKEPLVENLEDVQQFYSSGGALHLWDDKGAWQIRSTVEDGFYVTLLQRENVFKVLDIAAASGYHAIQLAKAGFNVSASDGLPEFVDAGVKNQTEINTFFPFICVPWSELHPSLFPGGAFDAVLCLGGSLHHVHLQGVYSLFLKIKSLLRNKGVFVVEQRNYERFFTEKPSEVSHPCGWKYHMRYHEPRTIEFTLKDPIRNIDASCTCTVTFESELIGIASDTGFTLKDCYYDYGKCSSKESASWIQYVFEL